MRTSRVHVLLEACWKMLVIRSFSCGITTLGMGMGCLYRGHWRGFQVHNLQ